MQDEIPQKSGRFASDASFATLWTNFKNKNTTDWEASLKNTSGYPEASKAPEFPLLLKILEQAKKTSDSVENFHKSAEAMLAILFPSRDTPLPGCVGEFAGFLFVAIYGQRKNWTPCDGLTVIDAYFDLTIEDLNSLEYNEQSSNFFQVLKMFDSFTWQKNVKEWVPKNEDDYATVNAKFFRYKWDLLRQVLSIPPNGICAQPGIYIVDDIVNAVENNETAIRGTYPTLNKYFPVSDFVIPKAVKAVLSLVERTHPLEFFKDYETIIEKVQWETEQEKLLKECLFSIGQDRKSIITIDDAKKVRIFPDNSPLHENIAKECTSYAFQYNFLKTLSFFVPESIHSAFLRKEIPNVLNSDVTNFILGRTAVILENEKKTDEEANKNKGNKKYKRPAPLRLLDDGTLKTIPENCGVQIGSVLLLMGLTVNDLNNRFNRFVMQAKQDKKNHDDVVNFFTGSISISARQDDEITIYSFKNIPDSFICGALMMRHYRFLALNHLMHREIHLIDPVISDTLCEIRPSFLMDCDLIIQAALKNDICIGWEKLVLGYNSCFKGLPWDESVIARFEPYLLGDSCPSYDYIRLCRYLESHLKDRGGNYYPRYLTLCKLNTRTTFLIRDRFGIEMGEDGVSILSSNERNRRRSEMGVYNTWYVKKAAKELMDVKFSDGSLLSEKCKSLPQTIQSITNCCVVTPSNDIEVVPIYQAQMFSLLKAFSLNRPLILKVKRIHILEVLDTGKEDFENIEKDAVTVRNAKYHMAGYRVLVYKPDQKTGKYVLVETDEEDAWADVPGFAVSAYSILDLTPGAKEKDQGYKTFVDEQYYSENPDEYFEFLKTQDVINLLNGCSANHPVFLPGAKIIDDHRMSEIQGTSYEKEQKFWEDLRKVYKAKKSMADPFKYLMSLYDKEGVTLKGDCQLTLGGGASLYFDDACEDFVEFYRLGEALGLSVKPYKAGRIREKVVQDSGKKSFLKDTTIIYHFIGCMPFYSIHIYGSSLAIERMRVTKYKETIDRFEDEKEMVKRAITASIQEYENSHSMKSDK